MESILDMFSNQPLLCLQRAAHSFQPQMKLEAVDKRSPGLIRVATVEEVDTHRIKVILGCACLLMCVLSAPSSPLQVYPSVLVC